LTKGRRASAQAAAINEVRVVSVVPDVQYHPAGCPPDTWIEVQRDTVLKQGDEISCDPDGSVTLAFADNSVVVVSDTTQLKIASFFTEGGVIRTEILLRMGKIAALVRATTTGRSMADGSSTSSRRRDDVGGVGRFRAGYIQACRIATRCESTAALNGALRIVHGCEARFGTPHRPQRPTFAFLPQK
jgi:hypothetical protein